MIDIDQKRQMSKISNDKQNMNFSKTASETFIAQYKTMKIGSFFLQTLLIHSSQETLSETLKIFLFLIL